MVWHSQNAKLDMEAVTLFALLVEVVVFVVLLGTVSWHKPQHGTKWKIVY